MAARKMYEVRAKKTMFASEAEIAKVMCSTIVAARKLANEWARKDEYKRVWILEYIANSYGYFGLSDHAPFTVKDELKG